MSHTNPLPERLRASADEVQSFPHPSFCDHLHVAHDVMREAAAALEAYDLGARSTAAQPVEPTLRSAALALIAKMDALKPHMDAMCLDSHNRGRPYSGPTYGVELEALRAAASGDSTPPSAPVQGDPSGALRPEPEAVDPGSLSPDDVAYPRDLFDALIYRCSPYAFYLFQWVPYQTDARRWRLKMLHDVRTFDGREALGIWPNGSHCGPFRDDEVEFIRISRKQHCGEWTDPRKVPEPPQAASGSRGD